MTTTLPPLPVPDGTAEINKQRCVTADGYPCVEFDEVGAWSEPLVRAYGAACAAAEREACAEICDAVATIAERHHHITDRAAGADACADAIRARKDTE